MQAFTYVPKKHEVDTTLLLRHPGYQQLATLFRAALEKARSENQLGPKANEFSVELSLLTGKKPPDQHLDYVRDFTRGEGFEQVQEEYRAFGFNLDRPDVGAMELGTQHKDVTSSKLALWVIFVRFTVRRPQSKVAAA